MTTLPRGARSLLIASLAACSGAAVASSPGTPAPTPSSASTRIPADTAAAHPSAAPAMPGAGVVDSTRLLTDLRVLADDAMQGRRAGTPGGARARGHIVAAFQQAGLEAPPAGMLQPFPLAAGGQGTNVLGIVRGTDRPDSVLVVTAHYDHCGMGAAARDCGRPDPAGADSIWNGADDNASGTAALLALARWFAAHPPRHSLLFAALDAEEEGLGGAKYLVAHPPVPRDRMLLDVNMDMVSRSAPGVLWAAGAARWPALRPVLDSLVRRAPVTLRLGHDAAGSGSDDWTAQSDQGAFHDAHVPFVYFGVEDHADYHRPGDSADRVTPGFFVNAVRTILDAVASYDRSL